jgi:DNA-directed RNA polymerase specialized sigma24 family protein
LRRTYRYNAKGEPYKNVEAHIYTVAVSTGIDESRRIIGRGSSPKPGEVYLEDIAEPISPTGSPDEYATTELRKTVRLVLWEHSRENPTSGQVVIDRELRDLSWEQIASRLELSGANLTKKKLIEHAQALLKHDRNDLARRLRDFTITRSEAL